MERIVIYTAITGGYDSLQQPFQPADGFEFICFVRKGEKRQENAGIWRLEEIPFESDDMTLLSRYPKINPHKVLPGDSKWSLWIDGNVRITDGSIYRICRELAEKDVKYAGVSHPDGVDCPYQEALRCMKDRREKLFRLLKTVRFLRSRGVPEHSGLMENNLIFRKHSDPVVTGFDELWWERVCKYSRRDQLTHTSCLLDTPELRPEYIFPEGVTTRNHPGLEYVKHPSKALSRFRSKIKYGSARPARALLKLYIQGVRPLD